MKQYALFSGNAFYPAGGWNDFGGYYDTIQDAIDAVELDDCVWAHVIDLRTGEMVAQLDANPEGASAWDI